MDSKKMADALCEESLRLVETLTETKSDAEASMVLLTAALIILRTHDISHNLPLIDVMLTVSNQFTQEQLGKHKSAKRTGRVKEKANREGEQRV